MRVFYETRAEIDKCLRRLGLMYCPKCAMRGTLVRHGYIYEGQGGWGRPIRAWRIRCKPKRGGCGHAPSIRLASSLIRRSFTAKGLFLFLVALRRGASVKAAWEASGIRQGVESAYRLKKRLRLCLPALRTALSRERGPPDTGKSGAGSPLQQMADHLLAAFGQHTAVQAYQHVLQKNFLSLT